uniref:Uncharacterized protein n=1 Tax=Oryzias sinensis TaxID=183150 RepID=A0A8C7YTU6_9TELE
IHGNQKRWRGDKDELKTPQANVGHGKELIVANVFTAGLERKERKIKQTLLLDSRTYGLCGNHQHHDPKKEQHREPDFTQRSGVTIGPHQLSVQSGPRHPLYSQRGSICGSAGLNTGPASSLEHGEGGYRG